jgi:hypothetical protein
MLLEFSTFITMMYRPIRQMADNFNVLQMGVVNAERVFKLIDTNAEQVDTGKQETTDFAGDIELKNVTFEYIENQPVLKNLNLKDWSLSTRKAAKMVQASRETIRKVYREELNFKPYKKKKTFRLLQTDKPKREKLAQFILKNSNTRRNILDWLIVSDEGYFQLTPGVNSQNDRIWAESQPNVQEEQPLHDQKILVWCAFSKNYTYGPYFFEDKVNGENYLDMLQNYFWKQHTKVKDSQWYYFQQDGAPGHIAKSVQDWLKSKFGERFLDKKSWPPRSPDLNPCDFSI